MCGVGRSQISDRSRDSVLQTWHTNGQTPQAPESKQESGSEATADPFLAHLQQKTEKELFEILRKQQQQPSTQDDGDETSDPVTASGEHGGPKGAYAGAEPTRYGDWEKGGRCTDF
ncbi:g8513 [Coccomyxa viridis]|uniref:Succinate dehydrogenase assembly factor 4, mitochondrial n=1 Tax=Coccomyxa viridis TaxID=1274662 RepID=A0ABP1G0K2_9CHLO